jgi:hypothetical protein
VGVVTRSAGEETQVAGSGEGAWDHQTVATGCPLFAGGAIVDFVPRLRRCGAAVALAFCVVGGSLAEGCTTIDPGSDFVIPPSTFEPQVLFAKSCGSGVTGTDPPNGCHYNSSAVSGMALIQHPAVDCGGGPTPLDSTQVGEGSPAFSNLQAASLEMSIDYLHAPIIVRPTGNNHPRQIFTLSDPVIPIIQTWAVK